jgi:hypothetical protein
MKRLALTLVIAVVLLASTAGVASANHQSHSAYPEVAAGKNPQPNPNKAQAGNGNPSTSANPEVPAGAKPQPN